MTQPNGEAAEPEGPPPLPSWRAPAPSADPAADPELRAKALKHLEEKKAFRIHLTTYVVIMGFLVAIWLITGMGYFWPIWPMMGWGIGLALHGASLRWDRDPTEEQVAEQARRLAGRRGGPGPGPGGLEGPQDTV
ncbi:2TM domain-containing protein [Ornithinimicrobium avium]|uniref:2TM domain-containing protein n=1 Tax=Ornithinimicrobium avium TaxID=2283195 RepID=A0A345NRU1_9MICO|nr:2TM domain-containing protein [Ornithinimicrobium avium]AXH97749.1 hypothetical protein DV701_17975 [Ornithinimicrobium avium]